jgi:hypothetical protein
VSSVQPVTVPGAGSTAAASCAVSGDLVGEANPVQVASAVCGTN